MRVEAAVKQASFRLSEGELAHALALFCQLRDLPLDSVDPHLNPHLRKYVRLASLELAQYELMFHRLRNTHMAVPVESLASRAR